MKMQDKKLMFSGSSFVLTASSSTPPLLREEEEEVLFKANAASATGLSSPLPTRNLAPTFGVHAHLPQGTLRQCARGVHVSGPEEAAPYSAGQGAPGS